MPPGPRTKTNYSARPTRNQALADPIRFAPGIGPRRADLFGRLGVERIRDALYLLPRRYEDRSRIRPIAEVRRGSTETVTGVVQAVGLQRTRRGMPVVELILRDGSGHLFAKWFNQPYLVRRFRRGQRLILSGRVGEGGIREMVNPEHEALDAGDEQIHTGRIVPIYPATEGLSQRVLRSCLYHLVLAHAPAVREYLPADVAAAHDLAPLARALQDAHFPGDMAAAEGARRRLAFDELFLFSVGLALRRRQDRARAGIPFRVPSALEERALASLPFALTAGQVKVLGQVHADMARPQPMNRLLQGDVGSGKTIVALLAALGAIGNGYQAALMAPTEILAEQHWTRASALLGPLEVPCLLVTGSVPARERRVALGRVRDGEAALVIGTHALLTDEVAFGRLGFAIVDEQHRFGVLQRARLRAKGAGDPGAGTQRLRAPAMPLGAQRDATGCPLGAPWAPDALVMTATPIPRTLALTAYGDLDLSLLDEMPPGRMPVETVLVGGTGRPGAYARVAEELRAGRQAYVVCPAIEETEDPAIRAATRLAKDLAAGFLRGFRIGLVHGRMAFAEREEAMRGFRAGRLDVLVATTVVEVGVDVGNATAMAVEGAERLGLSQLHQLRGRVGRAGARGICFLLVGGEPGPEAEGRLRAMVEAADGFAIAERDLAIRGPGDCFGTDQSGFPPFGAADLLRDLPVLEAAREAAFRLVDGDPGLRRPEHAGLRATLDEGLGHRLALAGIG